MQLPVSRQPLSSIALAWLALGLGASIACAAMPAREGPIPPELSAALREGLFAPPARTTRLGVTATQAGWRVPVILVAYSDDSLAYHAADFDLALFDSTGATPTGSARDYWTWASAGHLFLSGRVVATVRLPYPRSYYGNNSWGLSRIMTPNNIAGLVHDAVLACPDDVPWADFDVDRDGYVDMLWVVHAGIGGEGSTDRNNVWSLTSQLSGYWSNSNAMNTPALFPGSQTQHIQVNRFAVMPELSLFDHGQRCEIGVFCHEFGHALGLPDLYDTSDFGATNAGPGDWSLMGTGVYGGDNHSPEYPTHVGAWPALFLGWAQAVRPARDTTIVLPPLGTGNTVLELWLQGTSSSEHFLVEARKRQGFDRNLPGEGLVVYHVDDISIGFGAQSSDVGSGSSVGVVVVEADGNSDLTQGHNRGDAGDVFPGSTNRLYLRDDPLPPNTLSFTRAPTGVGLYFITPVAQGMQFLAQVQPLGWQPAADCTAGEYAPSGPQTPGVTAVTAPDGTCYSVESEYRSGRRQIVLRTRREGAWDAGVVITGGSGEAVEPALALLGHDDLAVIWSDTREGPIRPYYRARVAGWWTPEQGLQAGGGEVRAPVIAADAHGEVYAAWLDYGSTSTRIEGARFPYLSPRSQPFTLSQPAITPGYPSIAARATGGATVAWTNNSVWPPTLWYSYIVGDAPPTSPRTLTTQTASSQSWASLACDSVGDLHCTWVETGIDARELRYQWMRMEGSYVYSDTTLETSDHSISNARVACDSSGGVHVTFESVTSGVTKVMYRRRQPTLGWDAVSTSLTSIEEGTSIQPRLLPSGPGLVSVLYRGFSGSTPRFMQRRRTAEISPMVAVEEPPLPAAPPRLVLGPNPVRSGQTVGIRLAAAIPGTRSPAGAAAPIVSRDAVAGAEPAVLEVFDVSGRRMAAAPLVRSGDLLLGTLGPNVTGRWPTGVYLVRACAGAGGPGVVQRLVVLR